MSDIHVFNLNMFNSIICLSSIFSQAHSANSVHYELMIYLLYYILKYFIEVQKYPHLLGLSLLNEGKIASLVHVRTIPYACNVVCLCCTFSIFIHSYVHVFQFFKSMKVSFHLTVATKNKKFSFRILLYKDLVFLKP